MANAIPGKTQNFNELVDRKIETYKKFGQDISREKAEAEVVADSLVDILQQSKAVERLCNESPSLARKIFDALKDFIASLKQYISDVRKYFANTNGMIPVETRNLLTKVNGRVQYAQEIVDAFDKVFAEAAETTAVNGLAKQKATSDNTQLSIREIVDENGKNYGIGVYLDSDLLSNLTEDDRIKMVKEYVKEIGGSTFTAYDNSGKPVEIYIAKPNEKFINSKGKKVPVNKDITTKYNKSKTKQESVVLIDELVITSRLKTSEYANKAHGWLDNNGNNKWDYWRTFIQDKNNAVWEATLNIATTENGKKYLYDIDPIKMVAGPVKSGTNNHQGNDTTVATESQEKFSPTGGQLQLVDNPDNATPTANPDVRLMLSDAVDTQSETGYDYTKPFAEQVDDYKNGKFPKNDELMVSGTPNVWRNIGMNALPITINQTHIKDALSGLKDADHYLGEELLKSLPEAIKNPVAIIHSQSPSSPERLVVILSEKVNGHQEISAVEVDGEANYLGAIVNANAIRSVYGKENALRQLNKALQNNSDKNAEVFYWNKKEAISLLHEEGLQLPSLLPQDGLIHSVLEEGSPVKRKFAGQTETKQFKRWFGNSKAVNKDGSPRILYHWTSEDFTVFDLERSGNNQGNTHGDGIYLSSDPNEFSYAGTTRMDLYAAIKKPFEMNLSKKQAQQIYDKYFRPHHEDRFGTYEPHVVDALQSRTKVFDYLSEAASTNNTKTSEILKELGYDGVHDGAEWVAFDRNQVKSATDNRGTFDASSPDIRFQLADYIDEYGEIEPGENPAREVHLPKKTGNRQNVSQTVRTILEAKATPDEIVPTVEKLVEQGDFSYTAYSDKRAIEDATDKIKNIGWAKALTDWMRSVRRGEINKKPCNRCGYKAFWWR